jgi:carboxypeptidase C (cathepsin A)
MSIGLVTRFGYGMSIAVLALSIAALARAEDAPPTSRDAPTAMPTARKSGAPGGRAETPASSSVAEQHRLPPDSTTQHTLSLPGRTLAFTATAGSIRLFDDKGEPQADIAYTAYQLDGADSASRPVFLQWGSRRCFRLLAARSGRAVADRHRR